VTEAQCEGVVRGGRGSRGWVRGKGIELDVGNALPEKDTRQSDSAPKETMLEEGQRRGPGREFKNPGRQNGKSREGDAVRDWPGFNAPDSNDWESRTGA